jgi:hypothetical protein
MPTTKNTYRGKKGTAILAVALYAPRRRQHRISEHVDPQHDVEQPEEANAAQANAAFKFDRETSL